MHAPLQVSVVLENYLHKSTPMMRISALCSNNQKALREANDHVRASVEIRKSKDHPWVSATNPPQSLRSFTKVREDIWCAVLSRILLTFSPSGQGRLDMVLLFPVHPRL